MAARYRLGLAPALLLAFAVAEARAEEAPPAPSAFLPQAADLAGWSAEGEVRTFVRGTLHRELNGGADVLEEYGLEKVAVRDWTRGKNRLTVRVFRMTDAEGACGIYTRLRGTGSKRLAAGDGGFRNDLQAGCWKGRWYLQVDALAGGKAVGTEAAALLRRLATRVPGKGGEPALLTVLRTPTMRPGTEVLLRGPLALASDGYPRVLAGKGFVLAASAAYGSTGLTSRVLLVDYSGEKEAVAAFDALRKAWKIEGRAAILSARVESERVLAWRDVSRIRLIVR